jgi:hypothetical protein
VIAAGCTRAGGGAPARSLLVLKLSMMMSGVGVCRQESGRAEQYSIVQARDDSATWQLLGYRYVAASNKFQLQQMLLRLQRGAKARTASYYCLCACLQSTKQQQAHCQYASMQAVCHCNVCFTLSVCNVAAMG